MIFNEYELDKNSDILYNDDNVNILVIATSKEGIKFELKKLLKI